MGWACSTHGDYRKCMQAFIWKTEGKRPVGRTRHRYEEDTKIDLNVIRCEVVHWFRLAQDSVQWWPLLNIGANSLRS
jgi:hypothetical protein